MAEGGMEEAETHAQGTRHHTALARTEGLPVHSLLPEALHVIPVLHLQKVVHALMRDTYGPA